MITREEALKIIRENIKNENIVKHMLAVEAIMKVLGKRIEPGKEEKWAMAGLLHDGDYIDSVPPEKQGIEIANWVREKGFELPEEVAHAMAAHNKATGVKPESKMDWAIFCSDSLTGLIVATALVRPDKKLSSVKVKSVMKKFKDKAFAKGTRREDIKMSKEKLGIPLREFVEICLQAMQGIAKALGL